MKGTVTVKRVGPSKKVVKCSMRRLSFLFDVFDAV